MPTTLKLRFLKRSKFDSYSFIASRRKEPEAYEVLAAFAKRIEALAPDQYRNPYNDASKGYATISFKKYSHEATLAKYNKGDVVQVEFGISKRTSSKDDRVFYNPVLKGLKRLKIYTRPDSDLLDTSSWLPVASGKRDVDEKKEEDGLSLPSLEDRLAALDELSV